MFSSIRLLPLLYVGFSHAELRHFLEVNRYQIYLILALLVVSSLSHLLCLLKPPSFRQSSLRYRWGASAFLAFFQLL